jgi:hypothetical protein
MVLRNLGIYTLLSAISICKFHMQNQLKARIVVVFNHDSFMLM